MSKYRNGTCHKTTKRYPIVTAGPLRNQYVHRIVAAAMIGRELSKDEEVHHKDQNRLNFHFNNLFILGQKDHGWVSSKQAYFMRERDNKLKLEWDAFMVDQNKLQQEAILQAQVEGQAWQYQDGQLQKAWDDNHAN